MGTIGKSTDVQDWFVATYSKRDLANLHVEFLNKWVDAWLSRQKEKTSSLPFAVDDNPWDDNMMYSSWNGVRYYIVDQQVNESLPVIGI